MSPRFSPEGNILNNLSNAPSLFGNMTSKVAFSHLNFSAKLRASAHISGETQRPETTVATLPRNFCEIIWTPASPRAPAGSTTCPASWKSSMVRATSHSGARTISAHDLRTTSNVFFPTCATAAHPTNLSTCFSAIFFP